MTLRRPGTVPEALWNDLVSIGTPTQVEMGELLWEPGDAHEGESYLVVRGLVRLYHPSRKGEAVTLLVVGAGGLVGHHPTDQFEASRPHATGAEVLCSSTLLALPAERIMCWLQETDKTSTTFIQWLRHTVEQQLDETYTRLELEHDTAKAKVAHVLLTLDRQALLDRMTRQQIADLANLTIETPVRTISQFLREGVLKGSRFTVLNDAERFALAALLEPFEPDELPYS